MTHKIIFCNFVTRRRAEGRWRGSRRGRFQTHLFLVEVPDVRAPGSGQDRRRKVGHDVFQSRVLFRRLALDDQRLPLAVRFASVSGRQVFGRRRPRDVRWKLFWRRRRRQDNISIIDLRLCGQILNVPNEENRCVTLSYRNGHLIDTIHPAYHVTFPLCVYANVLIFVPTLPPSLQTLCLSFILSLSLR